MDSQKKTVFIVDDNQSNLVMVRDALCELYRCFMMVSGDKLFAMLEKIMPNLILLDIEMPSMNGYEILLHIKNDERFESIPVIFLTGANPQDVNERGKLLGVADYISKPFSAQILRDCVALHI